jgi:hypothetical protein
LLKTLLFICLKSVYRDAVNYANELGLEFGIAASPGWSETGGPWVEPENAMKKLVWSESVIDSKATSDIKLKAPPVITGPYQDLAPPKELNPTPKAEDPILYKDIKVLAFPYQEQKALKPNYSFNDQPVENVENLSDGLFGTGSVFPVAMPQAPVVINMDFTEKQNVRSATLFIPDIADIYSGSRVDASLEYQDQQNNWQEIKNIHLTTVPSTVSFSDVNASRFRVVITPSQQSMANSRGAAPGYDDSLMKAMIAKFFSNATMPINELTLSSEAKINQFEAKAGFSVVPNYYQHDTQVDSSQLVANASEVIDLTDRLSADGTLNWIPKEGSWKVIRFGWSLIGKTNHPATKEATGLEVDKLDGEAVRDYIENYLETYEAAVGSDLIGANGINALLTDSTEVGAFNWSPKLMSKFYEQHQYDPLPWLPTLTGQIINSVKESDAFLYDFRSTISKLHAEEHYGTIAKVAAEKGLTTYSESLEGWRPSLGNDMYMRRFADIPMAAVWSFTEQNGPNPIYIADMRGASSIAHLYGKNFVAAESMTSTRHPWYHTPASLKPVIDLEFLNGINRIVIHSSVHQPLDDKKPGLSLRHIGQFFNRHTAWAEMAKPWMDYIARGSYLLQQGSYVADVAYFYGEEAPLGPFTWKEYFKDVPSNHGYDFINPEAVFEILSVQNNKLITPTGASYELLYLGGSSEIMTLPMLRRLHELVMAGASVAGMPPKRSPSLGDDETEFDKLVASMWGQEDAIHLGKGIVINSLDVDKALGLLKVLPDVDVASSEHDYAMDFIHRTSSEAEIYFLKSKTSLQNSLDIAFRVNDKVPAIWHAETGQISPVKYVEKEDQTIVTLDFSQQDAFFVVFSGAQTDIYHENSLNVLNIELEPWSVSFEQASKKIQDLEMGVLLPLNEHPHSDVKYFSGITNYQTSFEFGGDIDHNSKIFVDLGVVGDLAEVWLNGKYLGTAWHAPYRLELNDSLIKGKNDLLIRVANRWVNRLIGDAQPDSISTSYTVMPMYSASAPLTTSGLVGPISFYLKNDK